MVVKLRREKSATAHHSRKSSRLRLIRAINFRQRPTVICPARPYHISAIIFCFSETFLDPGPKSVAYSRRLIPREGRIMIVVNAGWDAVDAAASSRA